MASKTAGIFALLVVFIVSLPRIRSAGFPCDSAQFTCKNQRCIQLKWKCDDMDDCGDGSDELNCPPRTCAVGKEFTCANGKCIKSTWKCDQVNDCGDNSDETGCPSQAPYTCPSDHFTCSNGQCIPASFRCDGEDDCSRDRSDGSDERGCARTCSVEEFKCDNGRCITKEFKCDHEDDCDDLSDERNCANHTCSPTHFTCSLSGRCIPARYRCDGRNDCIDGSDEQRCQNETRPTKPPAVCRKNERMCSDGTDCVHTGWICDGSQDCFDGSDEMNCGTMGCTSLEFTCANQACIPKHQKCDGKDNCGDYSDEKTCPSHVSRVCPGSFRCGSSKTCIAESKVCDGTPQCAHGEDERNCDIDECLSNNGHCLHFCTDTKTSFYCSCKTGYELMDDRKSCRDINECEIPGMCSQQCDNNKGSFRCSCLDGYVLEPDHRRCKAQGPRPYLMFTNRNSIRLIMTSGKEYKRAFNNLHDARALGFDIEESMVYWTDGLNASIQRAKLGPNSKIERVVSTGIIDPSGLAIDWVGKKIYWADSGSNSILVSEMDGTNKMTLISSGVDKPSSLVVDPSEGLLYWIDWGSPAKIERASMDGTDRQVLISGDHIERPAGLTIDYTMRKLYWVDSKLKTIKHCSLNGSAIRELVTSGLKKPSAVTVFEDDIYWTDSRSIYKANKFTGKNKTVLISDAMSPQDATIYHPQRQPSGTSPCRTKAKAGCTHLCLVSSNKRGYSCACPDGLYLQKDDKTCSTNQPATHKHAAAALPTEQVVVEAPNDDADRQTAEGPERVSPGLIIGLVVGALFLILIIILAIFFVTKRRRTQRLEILYNAESQTDVDKIVVNGTAGMNKKPEIKNRNEYKHFENINYDPANEPPTPPEVDEYDDILISDETRPVIANNDVV